MSIMKGKLRRSAVVVAFSLGAFQALSIVGATSAFAALPPNATCNAVGGVVTVSVPDNGSFVVVWEDTNGGIHASADTVPVTQPFGTKDIPAILTTSGCTGVQAGVATTTAINVTGGSAAATTDQDVTIEMAQYTPAGTVLAPGAQLTATWGAINWNVNLGANSAVAPMDRLTVNNDNIDANRPANVTAGVNGIDLTTDGDLDVTYAGVETFRFLKAGGSLAEDVIDLNGSTITGAPFPTGATITDVGAAASLGITLQGGSGNDSITGGASDDTIAPGLGSDGVVCAGGEDALDYSNTTTAINANLLSLTIIQGVDLDSTDGVAGTASNCEEVFGTTAGDTLSGDNNANWLAPGDGNDIVSGGLGEDTYDVSDASAGVTVDLGAGTSTGGSGTDTLTSIEDVNGSESNDSLTGGAGANVLMGNGGNDKLSGGAGDGGSGAGDGTDSFDGGSGIDTITYEANVHNTTVALTAPLALNLCTQDGNQFPLLTQCSKLNGADAENDEIVSNSVENAILGTADDLFTGSLFNNIVWPNGGQNVLTGGAGGIDTVNYSIGYTAGVTINLANGGGTGGASDSITGFSNAVGTAFNDSMTGTDVIAGGGTGANLLVGGKGNDAISANAGPDLVRGGAGNDSIRGGSGDDTLKGQGGKDSIRGGTGDDDIFGGKGKDFCVGGGGHDLIKTCEKPRHHHQGPNGPGVAHLARLSAIKP